jgi:hypothetical protein
MVFHRDLPMSPRQTGIFWSLRGLSAPGRGRAGVTLRAMLSAPTIHLDEDALDIRLTGLAAAGSLRRTVRVPYRAIRGVSVGPLETRPLLWRLGGVATRRSRFGTFRREGRWLFLATTRRDRVVTLALDGEGPERVRFAEVVLGAEDPDALAEAVRTRSA